MKKSAIFMGNARDIKQGMKMRKRVGTMRAYMEKLRREAGRHPVLFSFAAAAAFRLINKSSTHLWCEK